MRPCAAVGGLLRGLGGAAGPGEAAGEPTVFKALLDARLPYVWSGATVAEAAIPWPDW